MHERAKHISHLAATQGLSTFAVGDAGIRFVSSDAKYVAGAVGVAVLCIVGGAIAKNQQDERRLRNLEPWERTLEEIGEGRLLFYGLSDRESRSYQEIEQALRNHLTREAEYRPGFPLSEEKRKKVDAMIIQQKDTRFTTLDRMQKLDLIRVGERIERRNFIEDQVHAYSMEGVPTYTLTYSGQVLSEKYRERMEIDSIKSLIKFPEVQNS